METRFNFLPTAMGRYLSHVINGDIKHLGWIFGECAKEQAREDSALK